MFIELMLEISTGRHSVARSWNSLESAKSSALRATDLFQVASQAGKHGGGAIEGWGSVSIYDSVAKWFVLSFRALVHTLFSTSSWCSQYHRPWVQGKGPRKQDGRTTRKATILSRERCSLDSRVRIYRRESCANAHDVLRPSYIRKLKS